MRDTLTCGLIYIAIQQKVVRTFKKKELKESNESNGNLKLNDVTV